jgi:hypothetical protein
MPLILALLIWCAQSAIGSDSSERRAPILGADLVYASWPHVLIEGWRDRALGDQMADAFKRAGLRTLRMSFHGFYSPLGPEATERLKAENKLTNQYPWFPFDIYVDFIAAHEFTTVVAINVEEGPEVALAVARKFIERGIASKLMAIELSNEPHLNHRPWLPEEYAARAADVIERLTPIGVKFALPLTVGTDRNTPTKLSDTEWVTRMLRAINSRIKLSERDDIFGVPHLYSRGVSARTIKAFNRVVDQFAPRMRYLVTEFNIRLSLEGNPHLTSKYAREFARKLAELMAEPRIAAMFVHAVPYHSILYWTDGRIATVINQRDEKLKGQDLEPGWHLTPAGRVYSLYSSLAWDGLVLVYSGDGERANWAISREDGSVVISLLNASGKGFKKRVRAAGLDMELSAPRRSIVCYDQSGAEIAKLSLE